MSPPPHREKDAKVEGRDPPEKAKGTMEMFRSLTKRLLKVPVEEMREQQQLYEHRRESEQSFSMNTKQNKLRPLVVAEQHEKRSDSTRNHSKPKV